MIADNNKFDLALSDLVCMASQTERILDKNLNHVPVLVQLDSSVLKMDKQKFLVSSDISFSDFVNNTLRKKLLHLHTNDVLITKVVQYSDPQTLIVLKLHPKKMKDVYEKYKDPQTKLLILRVSRSTTYKLIKNYATYFLGY